MKLKIMRFESSLRNRHTVMSATMTGMKGEVPPCSLATYRRVAHFEVFRMSKSLQVFNSVESNRRWLHQELHAI